MFKMYSSLAHLWPALNPLAEYANEARRIRELIDPFVQSLENPTMLELGCGGGRLLSYFTEDFQTYGVDLSLEMILQSENLNPNTLHTVGDMCVVDLGMAFDIILVGDSIGYAVSEHDLRRTIRNCRRHLKRHGVLLLVPDWTTETFLGSNIWGREIELNGSTISLMEYQYRADRNSNDIQSLFVFLITKDGDTIIELDSHSFGLHSNSLWHSAIQSAGLVCETKHFIANESGQGKQAFICTIADEEQQ